MSIQAHSENVGQIARYIAHNIIWDYFGGDFSSPKWSTVSCDCEEFGLEVGDNSHLVPSTEIFAILGLDLEKLSEIFVKKPWGYYATRPEDRLPQQVAPTYDALQICRVWDKEGWSRLSVLSGKVIRFNHCKSSRSGQIDISSGELVARYYPDGRVWVWPERFSRLKREHTMRELLCHFHRTGAWPRDSDPEEVGAAISWLRDSTSSSLKNEGIHPIKSVSFSSHKTGRIGKVPRRHS